MEPFNDNQPLTDEELDRLGDFLEGCNSGKAMNVEELDGFFAALIAGPRVVMPSEYNREVFGGRMPEACEFRSFEDAKDILGLIMRHWNTIAGALLKCEVYVPLLLQDEDGVAHGNDWARGFVRGMHMGRDGWDELLNDDKYGGCLVPLMMLYHEHDTDPKMRPMPISPEQREGIIVRMAAGLVRAYRYFRSQAAPPANKAVTAETRHHADKFRRNDLCPCGSGRKYKKCCGSATVN